MKPFELVKADVVPLTHALAVEFRDMTPSPTERDFNPARLKMLQQKATAGQLLTFHWAKARMDGKMLRVNGQHSSIMLAELNGDFPSGLSVHVDEYVVDGPQGLALLFRQFDDRKSGRSTADISGAYQNLIPALQAVAKPVGKLGVEGITWYQRNIESVDTPLGDEQYTLFNQSLTQQFLIWLNEIFSIKTPELRKVPVVAAMYGTFLKNPEETRKFWAEVARGGKEYEDNAPSTILDGWLKSIKEEKLELRPGDYFRGCVYAWNATRDAKTIKEIRYDLKRVTQTMAD